MDSMDRDVLLVLFRQTDGARWRRKEGWDTSDELGKWHGVKVNEQGRVVQLYLNYNNLQEFASTGTMKASKGDALEHPVTEVEAVRSILVQDLPLLAQDLTESAIVQVFSAYGEISKLLLQTHEGSKTQRAVVVFTEGEGAVAALQANGRDILGSNCTVSLASSMPLLSDGSLATDNVSDEATAGAEARTPERRLTTAEWIRSIFAQGMVYTRLFDQKLGVSDKAKGLVARARTIDEAHNISGRVAAAATTATAKAREVDERFGVSEAAQKWAKATKESADKALENNPRVAAGVQQTGAAFSNVVRQVSGMAQSAIDGARQGHQSPQAQPPIPDSSASSMPDAAAGGADEFLPTKKV